MSAEHVFLLRGGENKKVRSKVKPGPADARHRPHPKTGNMIHIATPFTYHIDAQNLDEQLHIVKHIA
jgi:hypothetical protein